VTLCLFVGPCCTVQDTIKTRMQAGANVTDRKLSSLSVARSILASEGVVGLYRGGLPVLLGGGLMRSAQFGVYSNVLTLIRGRYGTNQKENFYFGIFDPHIIVSGFAGGVGRGIVEAPVEFIKIRRQVDHSWKYSEVLKGFGEHLKRYAFIVILKNCLRCCRGYTDKKFVSIQLVCGIHGFNKQVGG
jgi:hypothetical protein